uniref:Uncharacterized protein n=1 Tax=Romanomermis culicivorax TaxID=13658 RepID=A0A915J5R5_ROMCU
MEYNPQVKSKITDSLAPTLTEIWKELVSRGLLKTSCSKTVPWSPTLPHGQMVDQAKNHMTVGLFEILIPNTE